MSRIENRIARNPSKDKLIGLAKGLGVPEEEVFAVARGKPLDERSAREQKLLAISAAYHVIAKKISYVFSIGNTQ